MKNVQVSFFNRCLASHLSRWFKEDNWVVSFQTISRFPTSFQEAQVIVSHLTILCSNKKELLLQLVLLTEMIDVCGGINLGRVWM